MSPDSSSGARRSQRQRIDLGALNQEGFDRREIEKALRASLEESKDDPKGKKKDNKKLKKKAANVKTTPKSSPIKKARVSPPKNNVSDQKSNDSISPRIKNRKADTVKGKVDVKGPETKNIIVKNKKQDSKPEKKKIADKAQDKADIISKKVQKKTECSKDLSETNQAKLEEEEEFQNSKSVIQKNCSKNKKEAHKKSMDTNKSPKLTSPRQGKNVFKRTFSNNKVLSSKKLPKLPTKKSSGSSAASVNSPGRRTAHTQASNFITLLSTGTKILRGSGVTDYIL